MREKAQHNTSPTKAQRIDNPMGKRLYKIKEASAYLGLPVWSIRTLIWNGFPYLKIGHTQYLDIRDMDAFIDREKQTLT